MSQSSGLFYSGVIELLMALALILLGVFLTSILSSILGMAGGMVLMGLLAWMLPVQQAMMLHATSQFFANGSRAFFHRTHLHKKSIGYYLLGLVAAFAFFSAVTFVPGHLTVFLFLGIGPFLPLALPKGFHLDFTKPLQAALCGAVVTCFQLTGGVSGPLLDIFFQKIAMTRHQVVATKAFTQAISHTVKFIYFGAIVPAAAGIENTLPIWIFFAVIPIAITGTHMSKYILDKLTDHQFYKATQWVLWGIGVVYLVKAALLMQAGA